MRKYIDLGELRIGDFESLGTFLFVEFSTYGQTCLGRRSGNEIDDCAKTAQGFAAPVDADEREEPVRAHQAIAVRQHGSAIWRHSSVWNLGGSQQLISPKRKISVGLQTTRQNGTGDSLVNSFGALRDYDRAHNPRSMESPRNQNR